MRQACLLALACAWLLAAIPAAAQILPAPPSPVSEDDYWQLIRQAQDRVETLSPAAPDRAALNEMAGQLEAVTAVQLPGGETVPVDNSELIEALRQSPPDRGAIETRLTALMEAHRDWVRTAPDPAAYGKLSEILARPEFQPQVAQPSLFEEWWQRFIDWLARQLARFGLGDVHLPGFDWLVTAIGVLVLGSVILYFVRSLRANLAAEAALEDIMNGPKISSAAALEQAQQLAAQSDYRSAVRFLYLAAVLALDERGLLRFDRSLTNREVLWQASTDERLRGELAPVVQVFDRVWYGFLPITADQYHEYEQQVARAREIKAE